MTVTQTGLLYLPFNEAYKDDKQKCIQHGNFYEEVFKETFKTMTGHTLQKNPDAFTDFDFIYNYRGKIQKVELKTKGSAFQLAKNYIQLNPEDAFPINTNKILKYRSSNTIINENGLPVVDPSLYLILVADFTKFVYHSSGHQTNGIYTISLKTLLDQYDHYRLNSNYIRLKNGNLECKERFKRLPNRSRSNSTEQFYLSLSKECILLDNQEKWKSVWIDNVQNQSRIQNYYGYP
jgi:hypothetical protein